MRGIPKEVSAPIIFQDGYFHFCRPSPYVGLPLCTPLITDLQSEHLSGGSGHVAGTEQSHTHRNGPDLALYHIQL